MPDGAATTFDTMAFATSPQPFDSEMIGRPIGRLALPDDIDAAQLRGALPALAEGWRAEGYWLVSCRVPQVDGNAAPDVDAALQDAGFRPVETLVTLARPIDAQPARLPAGIDHGTANDAETCAGIGAEALVTSRYNADPRIDPAAAARLKAQWVRNAFAGRADAILCARDATGEAVGFNLLLKRGDTAVIDLIAVAPQAHRQGHGRRLVDGALAHYAGKAATMLVGTQAVNAASLALYAACGFAERHRARTYHRVDEAACAN